MPAACRCWNCCRRAATYRSVLHRPEDHPRCRRGPRLIEAARQRRGPGPGPGPPRPRRGIRGPGPRRRRQGRADRLGHHDHGAPGEAPAAVAGSQACHERWEHEGANAQLKTLPARSRARCCGPGGHRPWSSRRLWGYLLTRYALSALACAAATAAGFDPDPGQAASARPACRAPPGRRPGLFPLTTSRPPWRRSPRTRRPGASTPAAGRRTCPASSSEDAITPTASRNPAENVRHDGPAKYAPRQPHPHLHRSMIKIS